MCNTYTRRVSASQIFDQVRQLELPIDWADGHASNLEPQDGIKIRDTAAIVRQVGERAELSMTTWAWPGPGGKPVFNFRSEGRDFARSDRVLIPADAFFEFTTPVDAKQKLKDKWAFTMVGQPWFWIAGIVKDGCFTMLTVSPGPDVAPYHDRQIVVLPPPAARDWLGLARPHPDVLRALPAGALAVEKVR